MGKVRVLFFLEELRGGGAEKVLHNLVNQMDKNTFAVTVQTVWWSDPEGLLAPDIHYKACYNRRGRLNQLRYRLESALGLTYRLHVRGPYQIEIAYLEYGSTKVMAASTNKNAKKLAWVHSDFRKKAADPQALFQKTAKWYAHYDRIVCVSETTRDSFVSIFGMAEKTVVLYNTIDDEDIRGKAVFPVSLPAVSQPLTLVTVGRLAAEKGFDRLLRVHQHLLEEGLSHALWIVGDGPEREKLETDVDVLGLRDSVKLLGYQPNPYPFMKAADLLVCSSLYEGFSSFVAEGLILGKPILTTDCSGMRELLGESDCGLIVENCEQGLLQGLRKLLSDAVLRKKYAEKAAEQGQRFSSRTRTAETESFLLSLLTQPE